MSEVTRQDVKPARPGLLLLLALGVAVLLGSGGLVAWLAASRRPNQDAAADPIRPDAQIAGGEIDNTKLALPREQAKYLQRAEHLGGFVLGDLTLPLLARALRSGDEPALRAFLSEDFQGQVFTASSGKAVVAGLAEFRTWQEDDDLKQTMNRDTFSSRLLAWRAEFQELTAVAFKVMLMRPETPRVFAGPWVGSLKLRLAGRGKQGGFIERIVQFRCRLSELPEDLPDRRGWLTECVAYAARFSRSPRKLLEPMQASTGIDVDRLHDNWKREDKKNLPFLTGGTYLVDYDQDGRLDVLLTDLSGLTLYRGVGGGRFQDVTIASGLPPQARPGSPAPIGAVFADFNADGFPDLLLGPKLYRNVEGRLFELLVKGRDTSLDLPDDASQYAVADFNLDGQVDLYVVGLKTGSPQGQPWIGKAKGNRSQLWQNNGDWQFEDVSEGSGAQGQGGPTFAAVWIDANGDGWPDLMTSCETGLNDYLINQKNGKFVQAELPDIYGGFSMGITAGDIDNDGRPDIYVANMYSKAGERIVGNLPPGVYPPAIDAKMRDFVSGNELYHNLGGGRFERIGRRTGVADVGWAYGPGFVDLDNDGWLDLYAPVGFQSVTPDRPDG